MIELDLDAGVVARSLRVSDAHAMHALSEENETHLDNWLRWSSAIQTIDGVEAHIDEFERKEAVGDEFHLGRCGIDGRSRLLVHPQRKS